MQVQNQDVYVQPRINLSHAFLALPIDLIGQKCPHSNLSLHKVIILAAILRRITRSLDGIEVAPHK